MQRAALTPGERLPGTREHRAPQPEEGPGLGRGFGSISGDEGCRGKVAGAEGSFARPPLTLSKSLLI